MALCGEAQWSYQFFAQQTTHCIPATLQVRFVESQSSHELFVDSVKLELRASSITVFV